jgi:hypothetical protein
VSAVQGGSISAPRGIKGKQDFGKYLVSAFNISFSALNTGTDCQMDLPSRMLPACHYDCGNLEPLEVTCHPRQPSPSTIPNIQIRGTTNLPTHQRGPYRASRHAEPTPFRRSRAKPHLLALSLPSHNSLPPRAYATLSLSHLLGTALAPPSRKSHLQSPPPPTAAHHRVPCLLRFWPVMRMASPACWVTAPLWDEAHTRGTLLLGGGSRSVSR